jgi:hypothetical protein
MMDESCAPKPWIVCGFYTPDYAHWAKKLIASLEAHGAPHDVLERPKLAGGWEANTMAKADAVAQAMTRHPDKVVIFLDVDCEVRGDLSPLARLSGEVAFFVRSRRRKAGGTRFGLRSGTLVLKPTAGARQFVETWAAISRTANWGDVDQDTLLIALGRSSGISFTPLEARWCAAPGDYVSDAVIVHDSASKGVRKITNLQRRLRWLLFAARTSEPIGVPCMG